MLPQKKNNLILIKPVENYEESNENMHYILISMRFRVAKFISFFVLVLFMLAMIVLYRDDITIENFKYLIKYIDTKAPDSPYEYSEIKYEPDSELELGIYKGDLAVVGKKFVELYDMSGKCILSVNERYTNPILLASSKYMLVYDMAERTYSIYNSFSNLYSDILEYPISGAALSNSGSYAIVSKTREYLSEICVYDKNFEPLTKFYKDKYVMDVQLSDSGKEILIISMYTNNGKYCTEILVGDPYSEKEKALILLEDTFPIKVAYNLNGGFSLVCDNKVVFYDDKYQQISEYVFGSEILIDSTTTDQYTIMLFNKNIVGSDNTVLIFNDKGDIVYNDVINGKYINSVANDVFAFILFDGMINRIDIKTSEVSTYKVEKSCADIFMRDDNTILICYANRTIAIPNDSSFDIID